MLLYGYDSLISCVKCLKSTVRIRFSVSLNLFLQKKKTKKKKRTPSTPSDIWSLFSLSSNLQKWRRRYDDDTTKRRLWQIHLLPILSVNLAESKWLSCLTISLCLYSHLHNDPFTQKALHDTAERKPVEPFTGAIIFDVKRLM